MLEHGVSAGSEPILCPDRARGRGRRSMVELRSLSVLPPFCAPSDASKPPMGSHFTVIGALSASGVIPVVSGSRGRCGAVPHPSDLLVHPAGGRGPNHAAPGRARESSGCRPAEHTQVARRSKRIDTRVHDFAVGHVHDPLAAGRAVSGTIGAPGLVLLSRQRARSLPGRIERPAPNRGVCLLWLIHAGEADPANVQPAVACQKT